MNSAPSDLAIDVTAEAVARTRSPRSVRMFRAIANPARLPLPEDILSIHRPPKPYPASSLRRSASSTVTRPRLSQPRSDAALERNGSEYVPGQDPLPTEPAEDGWGCRGSPAPG